jgi:hypothetical protein
MLRGMKAQLVKMLRGKDPPTGGDEEDDIDRLDVDAHGNEINCSSKLLTELLGEDVFVDQGTVDPFLSEVRESWLKIARSAGPMSSGQRGEVVELVKKLYESEGRKPPKDEQVVFSPSPFVTMVATGLLSLYWASKKTVKPLVKKPEEEAQIAAISGRVPRREAKADARMLVYQPVSIACRKLNLLISCASEVAIDLMASVITSGGKMLDTLQISVQNPKVLNSISRIVRCCSEADVSDFSPSSVVDELGLEYTIDIMGKILDTVDGGNLTSGVSAYVDCLERQKFSVGEEYILRRQIASIAGPWVMHPMFCIVGERPDFLATNVSGQLHSDDGPACRWSDDTRIYGLRGVRVGSRFVEDPASTTVIHLEKMTAEQRVACFDKAPKREQVLFAIRDIEDREK